ncbi:MAG: RecQ family ATP-dependent DNA helicase [Chloroflexota bacterium]
MSGDRPDLDALLRQLLDTDAEFRPHQREAIEATLEEGARVLLVQRTGWGKSAVYWLATRVWRDRGHGPTLIISPLLSLMRDQIRAAGNLGLRAATVNSSNREEWTDILRALEADEIDVLLISPERLANDEFRSSYLPAIQGLMGLFVVDEVHCISDWGHDFRPDYRRIAAILASLPPSMPVLGTTATANARVQEDVAAQLGPAATTIGGSLARRSLRLATLTMKDQAERLAWLAANVPRLPGSGIIYCLTVADTQRVAAWLQSRDIDAHAYNGPMSAEEREPLERALLNNEIKALVATVALGMGYDKPDLGFVVHYQRPGSVISYYQQVGRAGRAVDDADGILLSGREDDEIQEYFMRTAFPPASQMQHVLDAVAGVDTASIGYLETQLNLRRSRLDTILKLLDVEGAVARDGSRYFRTAVPWRYDHQRIDRVIELRHEEVLQMRRYMTHTGCLMLFLTDALDDPADQPCGRCMNCLGSPPDATTDPAIIQQAIGFLRRDHRSIKPRKRWPLDAVDGLRGRIGPPNEEGLALSIYGDAGWGRAVVVAKYDAGTISAQLVTAAANAIRQRWQPTPETGWWVTAIPSWRNPRLVGDAARGVAAQLGLAYRDDVLSIEFDTPPQKDMENSARQLANVHAALGIVGETAPGSVILIDDIVDSGWTLTMAGHLLRTHGSGSVHPFVFAQGGGGA